jgi:hypothetical protein
MMHSEIASNFAIKLQVNCKKYSGYGTVQKYSAGWADNAGGRCSRAATRGLLSRSVGARVLEREGRGMQASDSLEQWQRCISTAMPESDGWLRRGNARTGKGDALPVRSGFTTEV